MLQLIRIADCRPVPWKNGAGRTQEVWKHCHAAGEMLVRISIAEIDGDQAFSSFPGIDRIIMQLDGPDMVMNIDGERQELGIERPLPFAGEALVSCALNGTGKAHDLNLMCRRDAFKATMTLASVMAGGRITFGKSGTITALVALHRSDLRMPSDVTLDKWDAMVCDQQTEIDCISAARIAVLTAEPT